MVILGCWLWAWLITYNSGLRLIWLLILDSIFQGFGDFGFSYVLIGGLFS